jgi:hypothetical protein
MGGMGGGSGGSGGEKPTDLGFSDLTRKQHFDRHGKEYDAKTASEYENLAKSFGIGQIVQRHENLYQRMGFASNTRSAATIF